MTPPALRTILAVLLVITCGGACSSAASTRTDGATSIDASKDASSPQDAGPSGPSTYACLCQRACMSPGFSCYGDCSQAPEACRKIFECLVADAGGCQLDDACGAWYHGGGACVQNFDPPPTGDCPDRCDPAGPRCRSGTKLKDGRCQ
jgi:hypothetical protein